MLNCGAVFKKFSRHFSGLSMCILFNKLSMKCLPDDPRYSWFFPSNSMDLRYSRFCNKCQSDDEELQHNSKNLHRILIVSSPFVMELHRAIDEMHNLGKIPDDATLSALADFLVKGDKEVQDALGQLIPDFGNNLSAYTKIALVLIENFIKVHKLFSAFSLLKELRNRGVVPDLAVYGSLLTAVGKAGDFKLACQIFKDLLANGSSDSASYFTVSKAFAKVGDREVAYKFCIELAEDSFLCNATVLNRLIYAFAGTGQTETALALFEYMKYCKQKPDLVTYNTIFDVLGKSGHGDKTYHEFLSMKELGHDPDIITYNTLINNFCRLGKLDLCLVVLKEMIARGFEPNLRIYTAVIDRFGRIGQVDEAMALFIDMKKRGCRASVYVYRSLISSLRKAGKVEVANKLSEEMNESCSNLIGPEDFKKKRR